jgi:DNA-binding transcriptional ArsR family regulator
VARASTPPPPAALALTALAPPALAPPALALTARDRELLTFAAEHRFVLAGQLAHLLGGSEAVVRRRLGALRGAGLVRSERPLRHESTAWALTRAGLATVGSPLPRPRPVDLALYRHDVGVTWLAVAAHDGLFGELDAVVSERRMRSEDGRRGGLGQDGRSPEDVPRHGVRLGPGRFPGPRVHYPDLVLLTGSGHRVAVELELTTKQPARRERILSAYAADPRIDVVLYLVERPAAAAALARSAARAGAREKLRVQRVAWADGRAPGAPPGPDRSPATRSRHPHRPVAEAGR